MTSQVRPSLRQSQSSRISFAPSNREPNEGRDRPDDLEEIEAIKRYEDFTTIDWVQDAARAQIQRRIAKRRSKGFWGGQGATRGWRRKFWDSYEAGQAWIVVSLIGACIGLNAAFLNIVTEWLSDIKRGRCSTGFYLNENFCCWGAESGCAEWRPWSNIWPLNYILYFLFSISFAATSAFLVKSYAPYAAGSGISEIKCIIAGFVMKGFLGPWTLLIKSIGLPLAIASGLSVGKEGPSVHYAVCTGNVISRFFDKYKKSAAKTRELLCACAAAGVAVAFGSPIGGVLFSLEEMSSNFPMKTMWRSFFCALVATAVLAVMNPFRTGQLVMFQVRYDRDWHFFEIMFFIILGVFGGLYGEFVIKWNLKAQAFRKRYLGKFAVSEATILAGATALICYYNRFLMVDMTESMEELFHECEVGRPLHGLCDPKKRWGMVLTLLFATVIRIFFVIISYGCKVPAGIFVPSMAIGASFGRMVGMLVQALYEAYPKAAIFASCQPDVPCITPGTYAFLGAAAALSGIMHITVSVVVIMFEITGALTYILPTMIVVGTTKIISDHFSKGGIADRMITFNGFPFIDTKESHSYNVPVSVVMNSKPVALPATGMSLQDLQNLLDTTAFRGFPIVSSRTENHIMGHIGRTELRYGIDRAQRGGRDVPPETKCYFTSQPTHSHSLHPSDFTRSGARQNRDILDFSHLIDPTPITTHPRLPLETAMEIFTKLGPRVILVELHGNLKGILTVKDCLVYTHHIETRGRDMAQVREEGEREREGMEKIWKAICKVGDWLRWKVGRSERPGWHANDRPSRYPQAPIALELDSVRR